MTLHVSRSAQFTAGTFDNVIMNNETLQISDDIYYFVYHVCTAGEDTISRAYN